MREASSFGSGLRDRNIGTFSGYPKMTAVHDCQVAGQYINASFGMLPSYGVTSSNPQQAVKDNVDIEPQSSYEWYESMACLSVDGLIAALAASVSLHDNLWTPHSFASSGRSALTTASPMLTPQLHIRDSCDPKSHLLYLGAKSH